MVPDVNPIPVGGVVTLTAEGWRNYRWKISDESIGRLRSRVGKAVIYTALDKGTQKVTADPTGIGVSSTNSTTILPGVLTFKQGDNGSGDNNSGKMQVEISMVPDGNNVPVGKTVTLINNKGGRCSWKLKDVSIGQLAPKTGTQVDYTAKSNGTQTVTALLEEDSTIHASKTFTQNGND